MFYLSEDKTVILDSLGAVVGYYQHGKFCQVRKNKTKERLQVDKCDRVYSNGLSPLEMEQVSELLQRKGR
jgi:hypothetical protein